MAEALAIEGAKWVASAITGLLKEGFSYLGVDISSQLQDLETTILPQFQFVIEAAERSSVHKDKFQLWLRELKDAAYEAEDVLDEYKYQLLEEKFAGKVNTKLPKPKIKLRKSLNKLEVIAAEAKEFLKILQILQIPIGNDGQNDRNEGQWLAVTTSFPLHKVLGREKELDEIVDKYLLDQSDEASEPEKSYSVVAIVGIGGAGKTTLAQLIYNDPRVAKHFDVKMWVCVSRTLDVFRHTREMIESASEKECPRLENLDMLQGKLIKLIRSKKLLLILDDVWYDNYSKDERKWENLLSPLAKVGKRGSKILVTTRTMNLPEAFRPRNSMMLKDLENNIIVSLFMHHAFFGANLNNSDLQKELENIGMQIVRKLHGSPLAAKAVGCQLRKNLKVEAWKAALQQDNLRDSQQALLWSYQRLDAPLQRCFSYFSLFPKGYHYEAEKMVRLWIAEGFINSSNTSKRMEDIGKEYFDELVSGSFLQQDEYYYNMPNLFHDLAEKVSKEDCLRIENDQDDQAKEIPQTIRHLSILGEPTWENNTSLNQLENLRTLIVEVGSLSSGATANLLAATEKYKKLRVLMIDDVSRETLIRLLPNLKHLRFLYWRKEGELPATLDKLYQLQVLDLPYIASLPSSVKNLINLRRFMGSDEALASLPDIGRLTSLQMLSEFVVKKDKGHDIGQLKNLNELRGRLRISNLENVEGKNKAAEANLEAKTYLDSLQLEWGYHDDECDLDREVLQGLQPHPNLTELIIVGYKSPRYPSWLSMQNLRSLTLENCTALEVLPPIGNLFPNCSKLKIWELCKLREFPSLPQRLTELVIGGCPSLIIASSEEDDGRKKKSELILPSSLQTLYLENCNITDMALSQSLQGLTSLKSLWLCNISAITTLPVEGLRHMSALTHLGISSCPSISSLSEHLPHLLNSLKLSNCPIISSLPEHLPGSLRELDLSNCPIISSLPEHLPQLLNSLRLYDCSSISSLPKHLPQSLKSISIQKCQILAERCQSPNGEDCPKIAHIPKIFIPSDAAVAKGQRE